jgi:hypothetical protein
VRQQGEGCVQGRRVKVLFPALELTPLAQGQASRSGLGYLRGLPRFRGAKGGTDDRGRSALSLGLCSGAFSWHSSTEATSTITRLPIFLAR